MSIVCIIEQDELASKQIQIALKEIDDRLNIKLFNELEGFYKWFSKIINQSDPNVKPEDLKLLIGDIQFLGPNYFSLIEKVRKLLVRRNFLKREEDLAIILTSYESPKMNIKQIESRIITNMLYKPFDLPILKQFLQVALANQKAITDFVVFSQKITTSAEMLKEVQLEYFNELGFTTRSNRALTLNNVSKYYCQQFEALGKLSILARCIFCGPHPEDSSAFQAEFYFVGASNAQVRKLRQSLFTIDHSPENKKSISKHNFKKALTKKPSVENSVNFLVFLKAALDPSIEIKDTLENGLFNVTVTINRNMNSFTEALSKNDSSVLGVSPIHALFLNVDYFDSPLGISAWTKILGQIEEFNRRLHSSDPNPKIFLTSDHEISEEKIRSWSAIVSDVIYMPIDRPFLFKRMINHFSAILPRHEDIEILKTKTDEIIRVANLIELTSISEACLTMKYYRDISFHSFRRFSLPSNNPSEHLELLASCYYSEKRDQIYINHFVFFGITDKYLKHIRKWILERYIASKESAA